jgi:uncharacterized membrane protein YbhN (UPF0104 family)
MSAGANSGIAHAWTLRIAGIRRLLHRRRFAWAVGWGAATLALAVFARSIDLAAAWQHLATANLGWIAAALLANFVTLPLMTEQWYRLAPPDRPLSRLALWECVTVGMAAMNVLPFGGGHAVAVGLLAQRGAGIGGGVSVMALEQFCDGFAKLGLLLLALAVAPLPPALHAIAWGVAGLLLAGFAGLLWLGAHSPTDQGWRARWARRVEVVRRPGILVVAIGLSLLMRVFALLAIYATQRSLGVAVPFSRTPVVLAVVTFATAMAIAPGNLGVYEIATIAAYRVLGIPAGEAAALALVQHVAFLLPMIATGYGVTVWRAFKPARAADRTKS